MQGKVVPMLK